MIRIIWLQNDGLIREGDEALLNEWEQQQRAGNIWIDFCDHDHQHMDQVLTTLNCHDLTIRDAQRTRHPPKIEHFDDHSFLLYRGIKNIRGPLDIDMMSLGFFVSSQFLITTHSSESISIRLLQNDPALKTLLENPVELMCKIIRASANLYTENLLQLEENLDTLEENISSHGDDDMLMQVLSYKTSLRKLRRVFAYHEKIFQQLVEDHSLLPPASEDTIHYLQDLYEKFERLLSLSTLYYDLCGDLSDGYLSLSSHKLNRTMQILTVITAVFVPLGFLAGIYGMNFDYIPELKHPYGYFILLACMASIATSMLLFFRHRRWL